MPFEKNTLRYYSDFLIDNNLSVHKLYTSKQIFSSWLYLAVFHGSCKLVGPQGQLRPLIEVHPSAHVVEMLEIEDWH